MKEIYRSLSETTKLLLLSRAIRSVGQGALVVSFSLYLRQLGWSPVSIGLLLSAAGLVGAALNIAIGYLSDRYGRRIFLLCYEVIIVLMGVAATLTQQPIILCVAAIIAGFGRGQSGAAGPFSPAEGAWLAEQVEPGLRGIVYSYNTGLGFFGMAVGAVIAGMSPLWSHLLPGDLRYRPLFALTAIAAASNFILLNRASGGKKQLNQTMTVEEHEIHHKNSRAENKVLLILGLTNAFNGLAIGMTGPLIPIWFALKFGVGVAKIGPVFALTFLVTGLASLITGNMTRQVGIVRSVVISRSAGLAILAVLPILPNYILASAAYIMRSAFNRGTVGARQALAVGLVSERRRGVASSLNAVTTQLPSALGPTIAGYFLEERALALPFYFAAALQLIYLGLYGTFFRQHEPEQAHRKH